MLLNMMIILAVISSVIEVKLFTSVPWLHRRIKKGIWFISPNIVDIGVSIALSWVLGWLFQVPGGLVMFGAAMLSTVMTKMYWSYETQITFATTEARKAWETHKDEVAQTAVDTVHLIYLFLRGLTWPFRLIRKAHRKFDSLRGALT